MDKDGSSVLLPKDEDTYNQLSATYKLLQLDPQTHTIKAIVMGYLQRIPLSLLQRHPQVKEATRCVTSRLKEETPAGSCYPRMSSFSPPVPGQLGD